MITIYILSLYRFDATMACLESVRRHVRCDYEVVLFENGSAGKAERQAFEDLERSWPRLRPVFHPRPLSCPQARSRVLEYARGDLILLLDNDCLLEEDFLTSLSAMLGEKPKLGGVSPVLLQSPSRTVHCCGIDIEKRGGDLFHPKHLHYRRSYEEIRHLEPFLCDFIPGGCSLFRRELFHICSYDAGYQNAFGDYDFCMAGRLAGYEFAVHPGHYVLHSRDQGDERFVSAKAKLTDRVASWLRFRDKWGMVYYVYPDYLEGKVRI